MAAGSFVRQPTRFVREGRVIRLLCEQFLKRVAAADIHSLYQLVGQIETEPVILGMILATGSGGLFRRPGSPSIKS